MQNVRLRAASLAVVIFVVAAAAGCGGLSNARKIDYRSARALPSLEVPPDLTVPNPGAQGGAGTATYSGYAGAKQSTAPGTGPVLVEFPNVKLMREGQTRYVIVHAEPSVVWGEVRDFLGKTGLSIAHENARAGLMETGWAENHALVGADAGGNFLTKWFKSLYSSGTRDKYRVRLERGVEPGTTEVYLSHEGMEEVAPAADDGAARPGWRPRPSDPELEAEMLHRLVIYLGGENAVRTAAAPPAASPGVSAPSTPATAPSARLTHNGNGAALLTLEDSLERAWRRVGLSLDRIGFTVEDRDRSKGIYYVRYIDPDSSAKSKGFFSRLFSSDAPAPSNQYQVHVRPVENGTRVEVLDKEGDPDASKTGERILSLLYEQLK